MIPLIFVICLLPAVAYGIYGVDTEPSEEDAPYTRDRESGDSVTTPEIETTMPEAMRGIKFDENDNPDEEYVEKNLTDEGEFGGSSGLCASEKEEMQSPEMPRISGEMAQEGERESLGYDLMTGSGIEE